MLYHWPFWARKDQLPPSGNWNSWLLLGGRGAGKTRAGAEWVRGLMEGKTPLSKGKLTQIALIGETHADIREVMVEGPSGLIQIAPREKRPVYNASRKVLIWPNGAKAYAFSSERYEALRGPQFEAAWCDEIAKWRYAQETWDMLQFGLRLGKRPRQVITTTPRAVPIVKMLLKDKACVISRASTKANQANLAPAFLKEIVARYEGSLLGRQELHAELIEDNPAALWTRHILDIYRVERAPALYEITIAVDPPVSSGPNADCCGIIVMGRGDDGHAYIISDLSVQGLRPAGWARKIVDAFNSYHADRLVAEVNQGGELIREIVLGIEPKLPFFPVRATKGKMVRAGPVAALYERGFIHHVGRQMSALEDEMCVYDGGGHQKSPDRMDALVWGVTALMLRRNNLKNPLLRQI